MTRLTFIMIDHNRLLLPLYRGIVGSLLDFVHRMVSCCDHSSLVYRKCLVSSVVAVLAVLLPFAVDYRTCFC